MTDNLDLPSRILYIEDDEAQHGLLYEILRKKIPELEMDYASDGREAWDKIQDGSYDFFILDWQLGSDIQGVALLNRMRQSDSLRYVPVLVISGYLTKEDLALMEEFPFTGFMEKPYQPFFLNKQIRDLYKESRWFSERMAILSEAASDHRDNPRQFISVLVKECQDCPKPQLVALAGAKLLRRNGFSAEAHSVLAPFHKNNPHSPMVLSEMGKIALEQGHLDQAVAFLQSAIAKSPKNLERLCDLGGAHLQQLEMDEAQEVFKVASRQDPDNREAKEGLVLTENVNQFFQTTSPSSIPGSFAGLLNAVGISLVRRGEIQEGLHHYSSAFSYVQSDLDKSKLAFNLALGYMRDVKPQEAKFWFSKSLDHNPSFDKARSYLSKLEAQEHEAQSPYAPSPIYANISEVETEEETADDFMDVANFYQS